MDNPPGTPSKRYVVPGPTALILGPGTPGTPKFVILSIYAWFTTTPSAILGIASKVFPHILNGPCFMLSRVSRAPKLKQWGPGTTYLFDGVPGVPGVPGGHFFPHPRVGAPPTLVLVGL